MVPALSQFFVKMGNGVTVATSVVNVEATPAWTTQQAAYNYCLIWRYSTPTPPWSPAADRGGLLSTVARRAAYFDQAARFGLPLQTQYLLLR